MVIFIVANPYSLLRLKQSRHFRLLVSRGLKGSDVIEPPQPAHCQFPANFFLLTGGDSCCVSTKTIICHWLASQARVFWNIAQSFVNSIHFWGWTALFVIALTPTGPASESGLASRHKWQLCDLSATATTFPISLMHNLILIYLMKYSIHY